LIATLILTRLPDYWGWADSNPGWYSNDPWWRHQPPTTSCYDEYSPPEI